MLLEILKTNQLQMQLLAEMTKTLGKVADILVPSGPPEALVGRFDEAWTIPKDEDEAETTHGGRSVSRDQ